MSWQDYLTIAKAYADHMSGCNKVSVGSLICVGDTIVALGANRAMPPLCKTRGCLRVEKYGTDSKAHREPGDCRAIHSEIDAISAAALTGTSTDCSTIVVTRYPCENCAKAIIAAGISKVVYGGTAEISEYTRSLFEGNQVEVLHVKDWMEDNTDR